jgi:ABC-type Fe3+-hydroxamate transport system substrate-binding protein
MGRLKALGCGAAAAVLLLAASGCGAREEPTGAVVRLYPVTVQGAAERPTVMRSAPRRIVPLGAGPRQILHALGLKARTITVNDSLVGLPLVGQIRKARPDLIVASSDSDPLDLARARTATHAQIYVEGDGSLEDVVGAISDIGLLTGKPLQARKLTAAIERERQAVAARVRTAPRVTVFVDTGDFATVPSRSLLGSLIFEAHGTSVAGASPEPGPFPLRRLLRLNPQTYLATSDSRTTLAELRHDQLARRLRAVRTGRFGTVSAADIVPGPGVGKALEEIARILHPDAFR